MKLQFGENFKRLRKEKDITQDKISEALGVSSQSVSRWELGICYPDFELLPTIANYFGVTIDSLLSNDNISKEADNKLFFEKLDALEWGSDEQLNLVKEYCHKYPEDPQYKWHFVRVATYYILTGIDKNGDVYPLLKSNAYKLLETKYRDFAIDQMIDVCSEDELEYWLKFTPYNSTFNRRGCLVSRYNRRLGNADKMYIHQGLENLEKFASQLDRRFPDCYGAVRKAEYHYKILGIIKTFGDGIEPPDGWKLFYAYKQLVLSACLFGAGKNEEGWKQFGSAMEKYKYIFALKDEWLDLGGEIFANLKVNKNWTAAIDEKGEEHELFAIEHLSFYNAYFLHGFLTDPRWSWFNSVRDTEKYKAAVTWAESMSKLNDK